MTGPLAHLVVIEIGAIGPAPLAGMMLADMGASVIRVDRPGGTPAPMELPRARDVVQRGRVVVEIDLRSAEGLARLMALVTRADVLIEGMRPGVAERLGFGPAACHARNPGLVYGRMTGFGQDGPLAQAAGHDITYAALSGALHVIGRAGERPVPPINLVADYGGGTMFLMTGILAALLERGQSGRGQVVDAAMVEGAAALMAPVHGYRAAGLWEDARGVNLLDGGAPFYDTYETADGRYLAVGPLEPKFFAEFLRLAGLDPSWAARQYDRGAWPALRAAIAAALRDRSRDDWAQLFEGSDACVAPVLSLAEAAAHPHNRARGTFVTIDGVEQPAPAPRFDRSRAERPRPATDDPADVARVLRGIGLDPAVIAALAPG